MNKAGRLLLVFMFIMSAAIGPAVSPAEDHATPNAAAQRATVKAAAAKARDVPASDIRVSDTPASDTPASDTMLNDEDGQTERQLLTLANHSRQQAGMPPLSVDSGLSVAALRHAQAMLQARRLSHQFDGEPSLSQRLAAATQLQLEQEGENVAFDYDAEHGHQHLMLSPPHRANLLNPAYNVVGIAVLRSAERIYIVQDFGSALPKYSLADVKEHIAAAVNQMRRQVTRPALQRTDWHGADEAACSMAQADKLGAPSFSGASENYNVLTYTSLHPETLPAGAAQAILGGNLRSFSLGACYARTYTYPTGVYWVVLSLE